MRQVVVDEAALERTQGALFSSKTTVGIGCIIGRVRAHIFFPWSRELVAFPLLVSFGNLPVRSCIWPKRNTQIARTEPHLLTFPGSRCIWVPTSAFSVFAPSKVRTFLHIEPATAGSCDHVVCDAGLRHLQDLILKVRSPFHR